MQNTYQITFEKTICELITAKHKLNEKENSDDQVSCMFDNLIEQNFRKWKLKKRKSPKPFENLVIPQEVIKIEFTWTT